MQFSATDLIDLTEFLEQCAEYFDGMADAEYFTDRADPVPNTEMRLLTEANELLRRLAKVSA